MKKENMDKIIGKTIERFDIDDIDRKMKKIFGDYTRAYNIAGHANFSKEYSSIGPQTKSEKDKNKYASAGPDTPWRKQDEQK